MSTYKGQVPNQEHNFELNMHDIVHKGDNDGLENFNKILFQQDLSLLGYNNEDMQVGGHIATGYQRAMSIQGLTLLGSSFSQFQERFNGIHTNTQAIADEYLYGIHGKPSTRQNIFDVNDKVIHYANFYLSAIQALRIVPPQSITVDSLRNLILQIATRAESAIEPTNNVSIELNNIAQKTTELYRQSEQLRHDMNNHRPSVIEEINRLLQQLNDLKRSVNMEERLLNKEVLGDTTGFSVVGTVFAIVRAVRLTRRVVAIVTAAFATVGLVSAGSAYYIHRKNLAATHQEIDRLSTRIDDLEHDLEAKLFYASERSSSLSLSWRTQYNNMVNLSRDIKGSEDVLTVVALLIDMENTLNAVLEQAETIRVKMMTPIVNILKYNTAADIYTSPPQFSTSSRYNEKLSNIYLREATNILRGVNI